MRCSLELATRGCAYSTGNTRAAEVATDGRLTVQLRPSTVDTDSEEDDAAGALGMAPAADRCLVLWCSPRHRICYVTVTLETMCVQSAPPSAAVLVHDELPAKGTAQQTMRLLFSPDDSHSTRAKKEEEEEEEEESVEGTPGDVLVPASLFLQPLQHSQVRWRAPTAAHSIEPPPPEHSNSSSSSHRTSGTGHCTPPPCAQESAQAALEDERLILQFGGSSDAGTSTETERTPPWQPTAAPRAHTASTAPATHSPHSPTSSSSSLLSSAAVNFALNEAEPPTPPPPLPGCSHERECAAARRDTASLPPLYAQAGEKTGTGEEWPAAPRMRLRLRPTAATTSSTAMETTAPDVRGAATRERRDEEVEESHALAAVDAADGEPCLQARQGEQAAQQKEEEGNEMEEATSRRGHAPEVLAAQQTRHAFLHTDAVHDNEHTGPGNDAPPCCATADERQDSTRCRGAQRKRRNEVRDGPAEAVGAATESLLPSSAVAHMRRLQPWLLDLPALCARAAARPGCTEVYTATVLSCAIGFEEALWPLCGDHAAATECDTQPSHSLSRWITPPPPPPSAATAGALAGQTMEPRYALLVPAPREARTMRDVRCLAAVSEASLCPLVTLAARQRTSDAPLCGDGDRLALPLPADRATPWRYVVGTRLPGEVTVQSLRWSATSATAAARAKEEVASVPAPVHGWVVQHVTPLPSALSDLCALLARVPSTPALLRVRQPLRLPCTVCASVTMPAVVRYIFVDCDARRWAAPLDRFLHEEWPLAPTALSRAGGTGTAAAAAAESAGPGAPTLTVAVTLFANAQLRAARGVLLQPCSRGEGSHSGAALLIVSVHTLAAAQLTVDSSPAVSTDGASRLGRGVACARARVTLRAALYHHAMTYLAARMAARAPGQLLSVEGPMRYDDERERMAVARALALQRSCHADGALTVRCAEACGALMREEAHLLSCVAAQLGQRGSGPVPATVAGPSGESGVADECALQHDAPRRREEGPWTVEGSTRAVDYYWESFVAAFAWGDRELRDCLGAIANGTAQVLPRPCRRPCTTILDALQCAAAAAIATTAATTTVVTTVEEKTRTRRARAVPVPGEAGRALLAGPLFRLTHARRLLRQQPAGPALPCGQRYGVLRPSVTAVTASAPSSAGRTAPGAFRVVLKWAATGGVVGAAPSLSFDALRACSSGEPQAAVTVPLALHLVVFARVPTKSHRCRPPSPCGDAGESSERDSHSDSSHSRRSSSSSSSDDEAGSMARDLATEPYSLRLSQLTPLRWDVPLLPLLQGQAQRTTMLVQNDAVIERATMERTGLAAKLQQAMSRARCNRARAREPADRRRAAAGDVAKDAKRAAKRARASSDARGGTRQASAATDENGDGDSEADGGANSDADADELLLEFDLMDVAPTTSSRRVRGSAPRRRGQALARSADADGVGDEAVQYIVLVALDEGTSSPLLLPSHISYREMLWDRVATPEAGSALAKSALASSSRPHGHTHAAKGGEDGLSASCAKELLQFLARTLVAARVCPSLWAALCEQQRARARTHVASASLRVLADEAEERAARWGGRTDMYDCGVGRRFHTPQTVAALDGLLRWLASDAALQAEDASGAGAVPAGREKGAVSEPVGSRSRADRQPAQRRQRDAPASASDARAAAAASAALRSGLRLRRVAAAARRCLRAFRAAATAQRRDRLPVGTSSVQRDECTAALSARTALRALWITFCGHSIAPRTVLHADALLHTGAAAAPGRAVLSYLAAEVWGERRVRAVLLEEEASAMVPWEQQQQQQQTALSPLPNALTALGQKRQREWPAECPTTTDVTHEELAAAATAPSRTLRLTR